MPRSGLASAWRCATIVLSLICPSLLAAQPHPQPVNATDSLLKWSAVTYLSGGTVYIDAGSSAGLREGSRLEVVRGGASIAQLIVAFISSNRAACAVRNTVATIAVGDSVRYVVAKSAIVDFGAQTTSGATAPRRHSYSSRSVRGRVAARYLGIDPGNGSARMSQPAFDVRLDGERVGGSPLGLALDVRAHRTQLSSVAASSAARPGDTRVYQASLQLQGASSPSRIVLGRQFAMAVPTIGVFDGITAELQGRSASAGILAGVQPDPMDLGISSAVREYGAYGQLHSAPLAATNWSLTTAAVGSYAGGEINREFVYLQGVVVGRRFSAYTAQEVDVNRGWRSDNGEHAASPTSTFATVRFAATDALSVNAGFDSRRNVRLYRDWISPETEFDDRFRRGAWGGASLRATHLDLSADVRSTSGAGERTVSRALTAGLTRLTRAQLALRGRATVYNGEVARGTLRSASVEMNPLPTLRLAMNLGGHHEQRAATSSTSSSVRWFGADADLGLGRSWLLLWSIYREARRDARSAQSYAAISWRF